MALADCFEMSPGAILVTEPKLMPNRSIRMRNRFTKGRLCLLTIIGVDERKGVLSGQFFGFVTEHALQ